MTGTIPGDPASLSALAAELARAAGMLRTRTGSLRLVGAHLEEWTGAAATTAMQTLSAQIHALEECADAMTVGASALQRYVVDVQHARALSLEVQRYCHEHGLQMAADGSVRMPWGAYSVEEAGAFADSLGAGRRLAESASDEATAGARRLSRHLDDPVHRLRVVAATVRVTAGVAGVAR